tara:strand:- start:83 stop:1036 length:954 start_codon:yes stop_codon:yes gene_type:complete
MEKTLNGALPTKNRNVECYKAERNQLFKHYLNHKGTDIKNGRSNSSDNTVIESIIHRFHKKSYQANADFINDIRSEAHAIVWLATEKYILGITKKINNQKIYVNYKEKFNFCIFASNQVKFGLQTYLYKLNNNKLTGKINDSEHARKIYANLSKWKKEFGGEEFDLTDEDFKNISKKYKININILKEIAKYYSTNPISGDKVISDDNDNTYWEIIGDQKVVTKNGQFGFEKKNSSETSLINREIIDSFKIIKRSYLMKLPIRERKILIGTKFIENIKLKDLSKKFNISSERVRQISETEFNKFKLFILNHEKDLELI